MSYLLARRPCPRVPSRLAVRPTHGLPGLLSAVSFTRNLVLYLLLLFPLLIRRPPCVIPARHGRFQAQTAHKHPRAGLNTATVGRPTLQKLKQVVKSLLHLLGGCKCYCSGYRTTSSLQPVEVILVVIVVVAKERRALQRATRGTERASVNTALAFATGVWRAPLLQPYLLFLLWRSAVLIIIRLGLFLL